MPPKTNLTQQDIKNLADEVERRMSSKYDDLDTRLGTIEEILSKQVKPEQFVKTKCAVLTNKFENDNINQYMRRENVKFHGLVTDNNDATEQVLNFSNNLAQIESRCKKIEAITQENSEN